MEKGKQLVTRAQYARMRMVDKSSVQYAINSGKIPAGAIVERDGKILIDVAFANAAWDPRYEATRSSAIPPGQALLSHGGGSMDPGSVGPTDQEKLVPQSVSKAKKEAAEAEMAQLKLEQIQGKLVEAEEVEMRWISIASLTRTKIMGIPSKTRQRIPELTDEQYEVLDQICREALEELANENIEEQFNEDLE